MLVADSKPPPSTHLDRWSQTGAAARLPHGCAGLGRGSWWRHRAWWGACPVLVLVVLAATAAAQEPTPRSARLRLRSQLAEARGCPDRQQLADAVAARLGRVPFADDGELEVTVELGERGVAVEGTLTVRERSGALRKRRQLTATDCRELGEALAVAISIVIDPSSIVPRAPAASAASTSSTAASSAPTGSAASSAPSVTVAAPTPSVVPSTSTPASRAAPVAARAPSAPTPHLGVRVEALAVGAFGHAPSPTWGGQLALGVRYGAFTGSVRAQTETRGTTTTAGGASVESQLNALGAEPCFALGRVDLCGVFWLGRASASSASLAVPRAADAWVPLLGPAASWALPLGAGWALLARTEVTAVLAPLILQVDAQPAWSGPPVAATLGAGARWSP